MLRAQIRLLANRDFEWGFRRFRETVLSYFFDVLSAEGGYKPLQLWQMRQPFSMFLKSLHSCHVCHLPLFSAFDYGLTERL